MLQQAAERLMADNVVQLELIEWHRRRKVAHDGHVADASMRPLEKIMTEPGSQDMPQMVFTKDDEMVETFSLGSPDPRFCVGI